jgi:site-specific DNA-methyltransferase (adenine-specific)
MDKDRPHPATFPIEIPENSIKFHGITNNNEMVVVLDPFMGIGTTSLASYNLGVNCVGFETDTNYFDTNIQILEDEFAVKTLDSWR